MIAQLSEEMVWSQIVAQAWCDKGFMKRLLSDPRSVLAEHDLEVPPDTEVEVVLGTEVKVDGTDTARRFILPAPVHPAGRDRQRSAVLPTWPPRTNYENGANSSIFACNGTFLT